MRFAHPFEVIQRRYITEKARLLESLKSLQSNPSLRKCEHPKYVFLVHPKSNKQEIAKALEEIYKERKIKVVSVNTINVPSKQYNRRGRMRAGREPYLKKAIVTLAIGDSLED